MTDAPQRSDDRSPAAAPSGTRRWPWIVGIVAAFLVGLAVPTGGLTTSVSVAPAPLLGGMRTPAYAAPFTLQAASALGRELNVQYDNGRGGQDSAPRGTTSSFSVTVPTATQYGSGYLVVSSSPAYEEFLDDADPRSDTVTCRITDASGTVVAEETGSGQSANANCLGY